MLRRVMMAGASGPPLWSPASLSLPVWSISDDLGNVVASGEVTTLANLGSAGNATANVAGRNNQASLNGRAVITADATFDGYYTYGSTTTQWQNRGFLYAFAVNAMRAADAVPASRSLVAIPRPLPATGVMAEIARSPSTANAVRAGGRRLSADAFANANDGVNHGTNWVIIVATFNYAAGAIDLYIDGALAAQNTSGLTVGNTENIGGNVGVTIGATNSGGSLNENYHLAEWGCGNTTLSSSNRERLEGYLAHQWGLAGNLPAGHPYKSTPP